jgi:hypothetical protein
MPLGTFRSSNYRPHPNHPNRKLPAGFCRSQTRTGDGSIVVRLRHGVPGRRFIPGPYIARGGVDVNAH